MDTLSHALWALALCWWHPKRWWSLLVGALPDLLSFGILFIQRIVLGGFTPEKPDVASIPTYASTLYNTTHSFVTWALVFIIVWYVARTWAPLVIGAVAHIALDIPTHSLAFFPTPFLWPLSSYKFDGISWARQDVWGLNLLALATIFALIYIHERSKRTKSLKTKSVYARR